MMTSGIGDHIVLTHDHDQRETHDATWPRRCRAVPATGGDVAANAAMTLRAINRPEDVGEALGDDLLLSTGLC
jgi:hypothetical protein